MHAGALELLARAATLQTFNTQCQSLHAHIGRLAITKLTGAGAQVSPRSGPPEGRLGRTPCTCCTGRKIRKECTLTRAQELAGSGGSALTPAARPSCGGEQAGSRQGGQVSANAAHTCAYLRILAQLLCRQLLTCRTPSPLFPPREPRRARWSC